MKKVLFIGSFKRPKEGAFGGVYFASTTLKSALEAKDIEIVKLDTTLKSIKETSVFKRFPSLIIRNITFLWKIMMNRKTKSLIVFLSAGNSYLDKLPSILLARVLQKKIVAFPVSGFIIRDYENWVYKIFIRWVMKLSDIVVCQSDFWKDFFISHSVSASKLEVIENWVMDATIEKSNDISFQTYPPNSTEVLKLIFVSRIEEAKGVNDIVELAKSLKDIFSLEINIYGDGSYVNKLQMDIERYHLNNCVKICGWLDHRNMQEVINKHHVALFTSRFEGYPNALLDYIFSKIPIVATNIPTVKAVGRDLISYYEPGNIVQFAEKIKWCHDNYATASKMAEKLIVEKGIKNNLQTQTQIVINLLH
ncbi:MAG TPA: glycosyltransferase [Paludibacter sp.]